MLTEKSGCDMVPLVSGGLAQLGERLPYKQDVGGSIPSSPTQGKHWKQCLPFFFAHCILFICESCS